MGEAESNSLLLGKVETNAPPGPPRLNIPKIGTMPDAQASQYFCPFGLVSGYGLEPSGGLLDPTPLIYFAPAGGPHPQPALPVCSGPSNVQTKKGEIQ